MATIDIDRIIEYEKAGKLRVQKHPDRDLFIANYTEQVQFKRLWDDLTMMCRGLIFRPDGTIVARPFRKFFNLGEGWEPETPAPPPPNLPFTVTEKMDGSLGILYPVYVDDHPIPYYQVASRGSFTSEQAQRANNILARTYGRYSAYDPLKQGPMFKPGHTYLFEIIYPENRIVVDYGNAEELVLLAIIDNETGDDIDLTEEPWLADYFRFVRRYENVSGIEDLMREYESNDNFEGFVVRYSNGLRLKVKLPEYLRLHKLVTGINSRRIWEVLAAGQSLDPFLDRVPDEFYEWVTRERDLLVSKQQRLVQDATDIFNAIQAELAPLRSQLHDCSMETSLRVGRELRKQFALRATPHKQLSSLLFCLLDGGDVNALSWKQVRPEDVESPYAPAREG